MYTYYSLIPIGLGAFSAFLSAIIYSFHQDILKELIDQGDPLATSLSEIKYHYDESLNVFFIAEMLCYLIASFIAGMGFVLSHSNGWIIAGIFIASVAGILLLRTMLFGLGSRYSNKIALKFAPILKVYFVFLQPLTSTIEKLYFVVSGKSNEEASRDEINALFDSAREEGTIEADEYRILKNIMQFNNVLVSDVMTPRTVFFSCKADDTVGDIINMPEMQMYSRFPIWEGESIDENVVGYVLSRDVLNAALKEETQLELRTFAREVYIIPENAELDIALEKFLQRRQHLFVVVDEYGGVEGLITMEDVLETILGVEIVDEADKVVDMRAVAKNRRDKRIESMIKKSEEIADE